MSKKVHATAWDMRRLSEGESARAISEALKEAVDNQRLRGRLCLDLSKVLRECDWLVKTIRGLEDQEFTRDQVGSQLTCIDVNVRYLSYDIDGLRKSLATLFASMSQENSANAACPLTSTVAHSSLFGQQRQSESVHAVVGSSIS